MAGPPWAVPRAISGLDDLPLKVGRPCVGRLVAPIFDAIHHQFCWCRPILSSKSYQWGESELATPTRGVTAGTEHQIRFRTGYATRRVRVTVVTVGGVVSSSVRPSLTVATTTEAATTFCQPADAAAPGADLEPSKVRVWSAVKEVTPNSVETVTIDQGSTADLVRILAHRIEELPCSVIDNTVDTWAGDYAAYMPGRNITDVVWDDVPAIVAVLRKYHKHVLLALNDELATDNVALANREDFYTKSLAALLQWRLPDDVQLPESATRAVTCRVLASADVANNGNVRFAFAGGANVDINNVTTGLAWYTGAGAIATTAEAVSIQGYNDAAGVTRIYAALVQTDVEAT